MPVKQQVDLGFRPHAGQLLIEAELARKSFGVVVAHRRFGKTIEAIMALVDRSLRCPLPNPRYAYLAPKLKQAKQIAWMYLTAAASKIPGSRKSEGELYVEMPNGARITLFGGTDGNEESMRGSYFDGIVIDEVKDIAPHVWSEIVRPALADRKGWALFIGTPGGMNVFYELWVRAQSDPQWFALMFRVDETNLPWLPPNEIDAARKDMSDAAFRQEFLCVERGTLIYTPTGQVPIERLGIGDLVLSHSGRFRAVTRVYEREYSGELIELDSYGDHEKLRVTPNHPVRVADPIAQTMGWVAADQIRVGDWLVRPRRKTAAPLVSRALVELLGWYICEGSISKTGVNLAIHKDDEASADQIRKLCLALDRSATEDVTGSVRQFTLGSAALADWCVLHCGKLSHNKRIPWTLIQGHERALYDVLMSGDGCQCGDLDVYVTVSPHLARDMQMLAAMLGMRAGISRKLGGPQEIEGRTIQARDKYEVRISTKRSAGARTRLLKHGVATQVRGVERVPYRGTVHNLEVQTEHSYVAAGRAVHNCDFTASSADTLITIDLASAAAKREYLEQDFGFAPIVFGVDVARFGDDSSVIQARQGLVAYKPVVFQGKDNMQLAGTIADMIAKQRPQGVFVDAGGGAGVIDRLRQLGHRVTEINFGGKATDEHYVDKRAEMWFGMKDWLERGGAIENDPRLKTDLCGPTYWFEANGKVRLESKDDLKARGMSSPDRGDALALTFAMPVFAAADRHTPYRGRQAFAENDS